MTDPVSIIEAVRTFIAQYSGLEDGVPLWVDYMSTEGVNYSIIPLPGEVMVEEYIDGSSENQFPFAFQATMNTDGSVQEHIGNGKFFEYFRDWLREQTLAKNFPVISSIKVVSSIQAINAGFLFEQGESGTSTYQITCNLNYSQYL